MSERIQVVAVRRGDLPVQRNGSDFRMPVVYTLADGTEQYEWVIRRLKREVVPAYEDLVGAIAAGNVRAIIMDGQVCGYERSYRLYEKQK